MCASMRVCARVRASCEKERERRAYVHHEDVYDEASSPENTVLSNAIRLLYMYRDKLLLLEYRIYRGSTFNVLNERTGQLHIFTRRGAPGAPEKTTLEIILQCTREMS